MRYAIVSDIHANLQAWNAVLLDIRSLGIARIVCLGDIVGYGPDPAEVLESVHADVEHIVLGNHDAVVAGLMSPDHFNPLARQAILWTQRQLTDRARRFLRDLPLCITGSGFRAAHGDFENPGQFNYVIEADDAVPSWTAVPEPLLFVGHTHQPALFLLGRSGTPHRIALQDFEIEPHKRYLVNVGSVGQPRDEQARASYVIHDTEERTVIWRQVAFDIDAYRQALARKGLTEETSYFLRFDPREQHTPVRERLCFSPPAPQQAVHTRVEVQDIDAIVARHVSRWRRLAGLLLLFLVAVAAAVSYGCWRHATRGLHTGECVTAVAGAATPVGGNVLTLPDPAGTPIARNTVPGWTVALANRHRQSVQLVADDDGIPLLTLQSGAAADPIRISGPPVVVTRGMRFQASARFRKHAGFAGVVSLVVSRLDAHGNVIEAEWISKEPHPTWQRDGDWLLAQETADKPLGADTDAVRLELRGQFTGTVDLRDIRLIRKD